MTRRGRGRIGTSCSQASMSYWDERAAAGKGCSRWKDGGDAAGSKEGGRRSAAGEDYWWWSSEFHCWLLLTLSVFLNYGVALEKRVRNT